MQNRPLFELRDVCLTIPSRTILENISLTVETGDFLAVIGPSGSGKTSLLRLFNGLDSPTRGTITYRSEPLENRNILSLRKQVGMVFQIPALIAGTIRDNLLISRRWSPGSHQPGDEELLRVLPQAGFTTVDLSGDARTLSGGEKQRLALARTLLNNPTALLLDEPTAYLDSGLARQILRSVRILHRELSLTVIMVTHDVTLARSFAHHFIFLKTGKLITGGTLDQLDHLPDPALREFLREEP